MELKKFAIRGMVILAVFVALCMIFSGTIRTLTTPKVRLARAKKGKMEEKLEITGKLAFPEKEPVKLEMVSGSTLTIDHVDTRVGYEVEEGDVLMTAQVTGYDSALKAAQKTYDQAISDMMTLRKKSRAIRPSRRDEQYAKAYYDLRDALRNVDTLKMQLDTLLKQEDKELPEEGYPKKASDALIQCVDDWRAAVEAQAAAQAAFDQNSRYTVDDTIWDYITQTHAAQEKIDEAGEALEALIALQESCKAITAPHDGYIAAVNVKDGDSYDGTKPLYEITPKKVKPVLRADISTLNRTVKKGTDVTMDTQAGDTLSTEVADQGIDDEGKAYVDVEITKAMIREKGNLYAMSQSETPLTLSVKSKDSTILVPVSAVRGSGKERYVYVAESQESAGGSKSLKLRKVTVKVLAESDDTASLESDITNYDVAYMEDRPLSENATVMTYLN